MVKRKHRIAVDSSENSKSESENSDVDSELLNLAKKKKKSNLPSKLNSPNDSDSEDEAILQKSPKISKKHAKKIKSDSEPEEGELTDTDSSDVSQEEFNDGYGSDLMGDEEDRRKLAQMTEKEREQEIFKRIEAREVMKTRFNIERKLKQAKKQEMKKQKNVYFGYENREEKLEPSLDLKERVLERKKTFEENRGKSSDKKFQAMNLLKARREEKREREEKEKQLKLEQEKQKNEQTSKEKDTDLVSRNNKMKLKASDVYSDDSVSSSDEDSSNKAPKKEKISSSSSSSSSSDSETGNTTRNNRLQYISTNEELNSIRLSRLTLEKFVHLPFFKKVVVGSFVRIMIGSSNERPVYGICEVSDVCETGKIYQLGNTRTNKGLRLRYGMQERVFRMEFVSNQEFTSAEFSKWRETCVSQGIPIPTIENVKNKLKDIKEAAAYEYKEEDIEKIVKEKERFKTTPYNYAMKKTQLRKERDMAQSMGDSVRVIELQDQLNQLEERATNLDRLRTSTISSISYINDRNRKRNVEEAEKAILAELKATKGQRADDPFTRRHTKPSMVIKAKRPESEVTVDQSAAAAKDEKDGSNEKQENSNEPKKVNPQKQGEDMYAAHDFEIKIDFDVPISVTPVVTPAPVLNSTSTNKSRSLNLEDYKRRKGFI